MRVILDSQMVANVVSGIVNHASLTNKNQSLQMWRADVSSFLMQTKLSNFDGRHFSPEEIKHILCSQILRSNRSAILNSDPTADETLLDDPVPSSSEFATLKYSVPHTADGLLYLSTALENCAEGVGGEHSNSLSLQLRTLALSARHAALRQSPFYSHGVTEEKISALKEYCSSYPDVRESFADLPSLGNGMNLAEQRFFSLLAQPDNKWDLSATIELPLSKGEDTVGGPQINHGTRGPLLLAMLDTLKRKLATLPLELVRSADGRQCSAGERNQLMLWLMRSTNNFTRVVTDMAAVYPGKKPYLQEVGSHRNPSALCELPVIISHELLARGVRGDLRDSDYFEQAYLMQDEHLAHSGVKGMPGHSVVYVTMPVANWERLRNAGRVVRTEIGLKVERVVRNASREYGLVSSALSASQLAGVICRELAGSSLYLPGDLESVVLKQLNRECVPALTMSSNVSKAILDEIRVTTQKYSHRPSFEQEKLVPSSDNRFSMR